VLPRETLLAGHVGPHLQTHLSVGAPVHAPPYYQSFAPTASRVPKNVVSSCCFCFPHTICQCLLCERLIAWYQLYNDFALARLRESDYCTGGGGQLENPRLQNDS
jgi:hypothetical protein